MANDFTMTNNTSNNRWDLAYTVDASGTKTKTLNTAGTFVDKNIQVSVTTPAGGATVAGGGISATANYTGTPTVTLSLESQTTSGISITDTAQNSGYYVVLKGSTAKITGSTTATRAAITLARTAGYVTAQSATSVISSDTASPSVTVNAASKTRYLTLPTAAFSVSGDTVYCSNGGWVPTGSSSNGVGTITTVVGLGTVKDSGNNTVAPNLVRTAKPSGDTWVDAANGAATTTKPTSGPYVQIDAAANTNALKIKGKVTSAGYGTTSSFTTSTDSYTVGAAQATTKYIPIKTGTITNNVDSLPSGGSSSGTVNRGKYLKIGAGYYTEDKYYLAQNNSGTITITGSGNTTVNGYATASVAASTMTQGTTTVSGSTATRGTASWTAGWITADSISAATFKNTATSDVTYVDISNTTAAPMLISGDYLYIDQGYTDNLKISLAKLVPDWASGTNVAGDSHILSGYKAYNQDGGVITGTITEITLPTAATSSAASGSTLKATISRSTSDQYINIPAGYNASKGHYKISAVANGSAKGPTSLSASSATVTTGTNTITLTKTGVTTTPTVVAGYVASATASTATVALTASVTTKAAATITPTTTDQTIASGTYLTGIQTISGDANLLAENIKSGVSIFGVNGTYVGSQITITDESDSHGGTIRHINYVTDTTNEYAWLGFGATFLGTEEWDVPLSSTSFSTWAPNASSTATSLLAAASTNDFTYTYNRDTESLVFIVNATTQYAYTSGTALTTVPLVTNRTDILTAFGWPSSISDYQNNNVSTQSYWAAGGLNRTYYYNGSGVIALNTSTVYGIYHYTNPSISSTISGKIVTAGFRRAAIYGRCSDSIFKASKVQNNAIDVANTKIHFKVDVYKVPRVNNTWVKTLDGAITALNAVT